MEKEAEEEEKKSIMIKRFETGARRAVAFMRSLLGRVWALVYMISGGGGGGEATAQTAPYKRYTPMDDESSSSSAAPRSGFLARLILSVNIGGASNVLHS